MVNPLIHLDHLAYIHPFRDKHNLKFFYDTRYQLVCTIYVNHDVLMNCHNLGIFISSLHQTGLIKSNYSTPLFYYTINTKRLNHVHLTFNLTSNGRPVMR